MLESGAQVSAIRFQGGWASDKNLAFYLQEAEAAQLVLRISPSTARRLESFLDAFSFLEDPPAWPLASAAAAWTLTRCR